ncbi:MAG TPA: histidine kinase [Parafilimonas sp.]|nr:histidine kinase [Parafilimonas sp.]
MVAAESNRKLLLLNLSWWIVVSLIHAFILSQSALTVDEILIDTLVTFGLLGGICFLIVNNMRYYLPQREKYWYILFISLSVSGFCSVMSKFLLKLLMGGDALYIQEMHQSSGIRFGIGFLLVSCIAMMSLLWYNQEEQKQMDARKTEAEQLAREAELFKLRQQLQPHFLFNSLNSISALTASHPEKARHMINQLSEFLRGTLKKDEKQWNSLAEEMQYLELYLEIEKVRFGYRLQTDIFCDEAALELKLPAMLLQPVVENAIKFGLYDTTGEVLIKVAAKKQDNSLKVEVENPFDPETSQPLKGTGFGLPSIQRRLFLLFARQDLLNTRREENHFITTILIPQNI